MSRAFVAGLIALGACAAGAPSPPVGPWSLEVKNESEYELRELRLHDTTSYAQAPNRLSAPLAIGGSVVFFGEDPTYVTFFRERNTGGPVLAFTTEIALELGETRGFELRVYNESFRFLAGRTYLKPDAGP